MHISTVGDLLLYDPYICIFIVCYRLPKFSLMEVLLILFIILPNVRIHLNDYTVCHLPLLQEWIFKNITKVRKDIKYR